MSIFKYLPQEEFALALLEGGQVRFSPLAQYKALEDGGVRGDADDGSLQHLPVGGLEITKSTGEVLTLNVPFASTARAGDIFVFCASRVLSGELAAKFESPFCVEIENPTSFVGRISRHVALRSGLGRKVYAKDVDYRPPDQPPMADWARPDMVAFIKPTGFSWQEEFRVAIGNKGAFDPYNVTASLGAPPQADAGPAQEPLTLKVGNLSRIAKLHRL